MRSYGSGEQSIQVTSSSSKARIREVMKSVAVLETGLPIEWETSVHVAIDDSRQDMMRVLMLPNQDTPYANGAFLFDMMLPEKFPEVSPSVRGPYCARRVALS
jgi:ubiquitin-protein ligase